MTTCAGHNGAKQWVEPTLASLSPPVELKLCWSETAGQASALYAQHELYVTPTPFGVFRYVIWAHQASREIVAWGEAATIGEAMRAAEQSVSQ